MNRALTRPRDPASRNPPASRSNRGADRLETGRDPAPALPAHLLRGQAPDPRPRPASQPLHRESGAGARQRGHGAAVYSHLGTVRHRAEVVEFRVEQHFERVGDQLIRLRSGTTMGTKSQRVGDSQSPAHTEVQAGQEDERVGPARLERATSCSGGKRSIQLSYGPDDPQGPNSRPLRPRWQARIDSRNVQNSLAALSTHDSTSTQPRELIKLRRTMGQFLTRTPNSPVWRATTLQPVRSVRTLTIQRAGLS